MPPTSHMSVKRCSPSIVHPSSTAVSARTAEARKKLLAYAAYAFLRGAMEVMRAARRSYGVRLPSARPRYGNTDAEKKIC